MSVEIRRLEAADAPKLIGCFERCYGRTYPDPSFYDARHLALRIETGALRSVVAEDETGEIVGHMGLSIRRPDAEVPEAGNTVVDPRLRGRRLVERLSAALVEPCREIGLAGFMHYPTTTHAIMQKLAVRGGGIETGILLDYVPAETDYRDFEPDPDGSRLAVVAVYQPISRARPRSVFAPDRYRDVLVGIYESARLERSLDRPAGGDPLGATRAAAGMERSRSLRHIAVAEIGEDLAERVESDVDAGGAAVVHVDLPLDDPDVGVGVERLLAIGFCFGAVLPGTGRGDVLRMQRVDGAPTAAVAARLETEAARRLLSVIAQEREEALGRRTG